MEHRDYLQRSIDLAADSAASGGGPFGAVIVGDGKVLAAASNKVTSSCDPTAHAEVVAIREACEYLQSHQLTGCVLYASCEPCPMCLGAIYWARLDAVYFAATREQAAAAGFDDSLIYREVAQPLSQRQIPFQHLADNDSERPFAQWHSNAGKTLY
ncbi:nucleoside deaminase [Gilvimarinus xylanilyticus]|uniref:Nucleoside deaminase n=1 Tax=Gilvimarinus xylanilyticus TaxID=2944139 RepID=A0A9X2HWL0_9GAMM|nr:nucleoside deaminase [Gilvimarinus xylanilyticus]MCP8899733.1 nucleoside deaminase [Gilvimarinus xylanilyticus]